jgi:hypothetical protein
VNSADPNLDPPEWRLDRGDAVLVRHGGHAASHESATANLDLVALPG